MKVALVKLSICKCGFPLLNESIPLGTEYEIDPARIQNGVMICGGCRARVPFKGVWAEARLPGGRPGFLPEIVFSHQKAS